MRAMTDERAFLISLRANPADDTARLVYADWLDDQADGESTTRAAYLRLEFRLARLAEADPAREGLIRQLRALAAQLPMQWKTLVAKVPLENCGIGWKFVCPQRWDRLRETGQPSVRFCSACKRNVYFCASIDEARDRAGDGQCVALDLRVRRAPGDLADVSSPQETEDELQVLGLLDDEDL
jgi:uncharacterized protein (TIGR02996 family)